MYCSPNVFTRIHITKEWEKVYFVVGSGGN